MQMKMVFSKISNNYIFKIIKALVIFIIVIIILNIVHIDEMFSDSINFIENKLFEKKLTYTIKNERELDVKTADDLVGFWKSIDIDFDTRYEAKIDNDSITIYKYVSNDSLDIARNINKKNLTKRTKNKTNNKFDFLI